MAVRTWVGRFCVGRGPRRGRRPVARLAHPPAPRRRGRRAVRARRAGDGRERRVHGAARRRRSRSSTASDALSLTGALTRSLARRARASARLEPQEPAGTSRRRRRELASRCAAARPTSRRSGPSVAYVRTAAGDVRRIRERRRRTSSMRSASPRTSSRGSRASRSIRATSCSSRPARIDDVLPERTSSASSRAAPTTRCRSSTCSAATCPNFALVLLSCFEPEPEAPPDFLTRDGSDERRACRTGGRCAARRRGACSSAPLRGDAPPSAEASLAAGAPATSRCRPRPIHEQVREITESTAPPPATGVRLRGDSATPRYRRTTGAVPLPQFRIPALLVVAARRARRSSACSPMSTSPAP